MHSISTPQKIAGWGKKSDGGKQNKKEMELWNGQTFNEMFHCLPKSFAYFANGNFH